MLSLIAGVAIGIGCACLWFAGLRLFLQSDLPGPRKAAWTVFLVLLGVAIGIVLPLSEIWTKFLVLLVSLPLLGLADVVLFRSRRGLSFWIRACGFEVCTVFGAGAASRLLLDLAAARR